MKESAYSQDDLIAAPATPLVPSAVGIIRTSGLGCVEALVPLFSQGADLGSAQGYTMVYGHLMDPQAHEAVDQVMLGVFRAPRSYTGEESVEIYCHGSPAVMEAVLALLGRHGFRRAEPGEFSFRAFMNGKMDLTRAEAVHELVTARTDAARRLALTRLSGGLERRLAALQKDLLDVSAAMALYLDYPEDEADPPSPDSFPLASMESQLQSLLDSYRVGRLYHEGALMVLAGPTNAGKSSLFNLFLKEERSLVSDIHGTTRDFLEADVALEGIPLRLVDTAGLRQGADSLEAEGIRRSEALIEKAHLVLFLADAAAGLRDEDQQRIRSWEEAGFPVICLWNKVDLSQAKPVPPGFLGISAETGEGFPELHRRLAAELKKGSSAEGTVIESERQRQGLEEALAALRLVRRGIEQGQPLDMVSVDLEEVRDALGRITGEITSQEVLNHMFSHFCVGK